MKTKKDSTVPFEKEGLQFSVTNNMVQPTSYFGRSYIELNFGDRAREYFKADCYQTTRHEAVERFQKRVSPSVISILLEKSRKPEMKLLHQKQSSKANATDSTRAESPEMEAILNANKTDWWTTGVHNLSKRLQNIDLIQLENEAGKMGYRLMWYRNHFGLLDFYLVDSEHTEIAPHLFIIESYQISSFPLTYGAGAIVKTLSVAPMEKTKLFVQTYKHRKHEDNFGSCVLDSNSPESAHEFQNCLISENHSNDSKNSAYEFYTTTEVDPMLFTCTVNKDALTNINIERAEFTKNLWKALLKHSSRAASKREIIVNTETDANVQNNSLIAREYSNPNPGCTVNYIFRQLNQEYLSVIHLTDIRIGFTNGITTKEYPLHLMDNCITECFFPETHDEVKKCIVNAIMDIQDYKNEPIRNKDIIRTISLPDSTSAKKTYIFNPQHLCSIVEKGQEINLNGIIVSTMNFVLPTDSLIVDSVLGQGDMLDTHIRNMQEQELRERILANDMKEKEVEKLKLAESIVRETTPEKAKLFEEVFNRFDNDKWS